MARKAGSSGRQLIGTGVAICALTVGALLLHLALGNQSLTGRGGTWIVVGFPAGLSAIVIGMLKSRKR